MTKQELMENYTLEQLADMIIEKDNRFEIEERPYGVNYDFGEGKVIRFVGFEREESEPLFQMIMSRENKCDFGKLEKRKPFTDKELVEKWKKLAEELNEKGYSAIEENEKLKYEIKRKETIINQIDDVLEKLFGVTHDVGKPEEFGMILEKKIQSYEYQIKELEMELEYKDGTKMFETLFENTDGEAKDLLAQHMYENLKCVRTNARMEDDIDISDILPFEPIKVADMLISAKGKCGKNEPGMVVFECNLYGIQQLRQIAQHLLIYCDANEKE